MAGIKKVNVAEVREKVADALKKLPASELVGLHNDYCERNNMADCCIYDLDAWFKDDLPQMQPADAFKLGLMASCFCLSDAWCMYDEDENIRTTDDPVAACWIDIGALADDLLTGSDYMSSGLVQLTETDSVAVM